ncbi:MAG: hypothetical protein UY92_C0009G0064 [Candidatus Magasanikbacteria bacterium GW2011_GWA2_56_11]|uniref:Uncharacterized protein n=1 Tax=Candidatus Magasanikbacteria bacterium GW2011_GWA2_56_11 TaxID=1619044 RepID=A0A0G1YGE3_9BACT|nr:MAG: hypothetical protein UY92_C0009G0064 [Candidatus Magasanikbacteria bacterium GW2011_GWA2_56_11]
MYSSYTSTVREKTVQFVVGDGPLASAARLIRDRELTAQEKDVVLANYYNDIYHLFLNKLVEFHAMPSADKEAEEKLRSLLDELVKIKHLFG